MNDPQPSFVALIVWGTIVASLGFWLCRRRPWLTLFWVAGSTCLPLVALVTGGESASSYRIVASIALAAGVVFPVIGAVAGGFRFWSEGATISARHPDRTPGHTHGSGFEGSSEEPKVAEPELRPR